MRIWIINPFDPLPGEGVRPGRYWTLAETLAKRGHDVIWWSSNFSHLFKCEREPSNLDKVSFEVRLIKARPYRGNIGFARLVNHREFAKRFLTQARSILRSGDLAAPDRLIVSVPPLTTPIAAFILRQEWGGKVILDIQDAWPETFYRLLPGSGKIRQLLEKAVFAPWRRQAERAYANADAFTAVAWSYLRLAGVESRGRPFHMAPLGVALDDLDKYLPGKRASAIPFTFLYLGSMSTNYDLETLVYAANMLSLKGYEFRVIIAGSGRKETYLKGLVSSLDLSSKVEFKGFLNFSDMAFVLAESDVGLNLIFPESYIAIPNKIGDYLGAGLPVVNSISGELAELLQAHGAGVFYRAGDAESLYAAMEDYLMDTSKARAQGRRARQLAELMFSRESRYPILADFIESIQ